MAKTKVPLRMWGHTVTRRRGIDEKGAHLVPFLLLSFLSLPVFLPYFLLKHLTLAVQQNCQLSYLICPLFYFFFLRMHELRCWNNFWEWSLKSIICKKYHKQFCSLPRFEKHRAPRLRRKGLMGKRTKWDMPSCSLTYQLSPISTNLFTTSESLSALLECLSVLRKADTHPEREDTFGLIFFILGSSWVLPE